MKRTGESVLLVVSFLFMIGLVFFGSIGKGSAEPRGVMKLAIHWDMRADYNDPSDGRENLTWFNLYLFHDALVKPMPGQWFAPCLAESWTISKDHRVYEFKLRKGVKFHNGDEMTADDVVFSFKRYRGGRAEEIKNSIEKLEAPNPYLFRVTFKKPKLDFFEYFIPGDVTIGFVVPKKYIEKVGDEEYRKNPVGCGPYKFVEFKPGQVLVAEAFKDYWRKEPNIKRLEFDIVPEPATRYAMLKRGEVDVATLMITELYDKVKADPTLRTAEPVASTVWSVYMGGQFDPKSPWADPRVRKAASLAIDRELIAKLYQPGAPVEGNFGPKTDSNNVSFPPDPHDPAAAKKLLAEAGYPNGFNGGKFFPFDGFGPYWPMSEQVMNDLKAIGITFELVRVDRPTFFTKRTAGEFKGGTWVEPVANLPVTQKLGYLLGGGGPSYGTYPDIQALWDKHQASTSEKERKDLITRVQKMYHDRTMFIIICGGTSAAAIGPRPKGNLWKIPYAAWWVCPMEDLELNSYN